MKFFSLAGKALILGSSFFTAGVAVQATAGDLISGAELKSHVQEVLLSRGLASNPVISGNRKFRACAEPLEVTPMFGGYKTVHLTCPDNDGFKIAVRTQIGQFQAEQLEVKSSQPEIGRLSGFVVLTKSMKRGEIIGEGDVMLAQRAASQSGGYFHDIDDVVGRKARRAININQIIRTRHLELNYAIYKGQSVIIESKIGPVTVISAGVSIADAQLGERVKVKNGSSGLVVEGVALSEKKIRIITK